MAQNFFQCAHIHAILIHQCGGGVTQFVGGIFFAPQAGHLQLTAHHPFHRLLIDAPSYPADKKGLGIFGTGLDSFGQIGFDGLLAGVVEIDHSLFVALAQHLKGVSPHIGKVDAYQLGDPQAAVEKQGNDAIISLGIGALHMAQQLHAFFHRRWRGRDFLFLGDSRFCTGL